MKINKYKYEGYERKWVTLHLNPHPTNPSSANHVDIFSGYFHKLYKVPPHRFLFLVTQQTKQKFSLGDFKQIISDSDSEKSHNILQDKIIVHRMSCYSILTFNRLQTSFGYTFLQISYTFILYFFFKFLNSIFNF